ncbi:hypothetical protein ACWCPT_05915 [Streptomyces sp. NPDC002308]
MKVRADIAAMLHAGHSDAEITRQLHVCNRTAAAARQTLGLDAHRRGRVAAPDAESLFWDRTAPVDGDHLTWTGSVSTSGVPSFRWKGATYTAGRTAFRIQHGRDPIGYAKAGCGYPGCVAPAHIEDQPMRDRLRLQLTSIFGATS